MNRPIGTLEEDFTFLNVLQEGSTSTSEGDDFDLDGDVLAERSIKLKKVRGAKKMKSRRYAHKYYKAHKQKLKRLRRSAKYKLRRKKLKRMGGAKKGRRRQIPGMSSGIEIAANVMESLGHSTNVGQYGVAYQNIALLARDVGASYDTLSEEYLSSVVDFGVMSDACDGIANEAMEFAQAIEEHTYDLGAQDRALLDHHLDKISEELENIFDVLLDTEAAIDLTEGDDEDDFIDEEDMDVVDLGALEEAGVEVIDFDEYQAMLEYDESAYKGGFGHANGQVHSIGNVMDPLGISRAGHQEKIVLKNQLRRETAEDMDLDDDLFAEDYE